MMSVCKLHLFDLILANKSIIGKKMLRLDDHIMPFFNVWMINEPNVPFVLLKLYLENESVFANTISFGYLSQKGDELETLIIHDKPEEAYPLKDKLISYNGRSYKVKVHINTKESFTVGLEKKEDYFVSAIKKVFLIKDKGNFLSILKKGKGEAVGKEVKNE